MPNNKEEIQFSDWFHEHVSDDNCRCILTYGVAATAPPGLIYYCETMAKYRSNTEEIWELVLSDAENLQQVLEHTDICCQAHFENFMVWRACTVLAIRRMSL